MKKKKVEHKTGSLKDSGIPKLTKPRTAVEQTEFLITKTRDEMNLHKKYN